MNISTKRRRHFVLGCTCLMLTDVTVIGALVNKDLLYGVKRYDSTFSYHIRR